MSLESACSLLRKATAISARAMNANVVGGRRTTTATNHMPFDWEPRADQSRAFSTSLVKEPLGREPENWCTTSPPRTTANVGMELTP